VMCGLLHGQARAQARTVCRFWVTVSCSQLKREAVQ
jgi:hypothetical protein